MIKVRIGIPLAAATDGIVQTKDDLLTSAKELSRSSDVSVELAPAPSRHAFPGQEIVVLIFSFAGSVSASILANWLYDKFRDRGTTVIIGRDEVRIENAEKLKEIIIETASEPQD